MCLRKLSVITFVLVLAGPGIVRGDTIEFNSGKTREGRIVRENSEELVFQDPFTGEITFKKATIKSIKRSGDQPATGQTADAIKEASAHISSGRFKQGMDLLLSTSKGDPQAIAQCRSPFQAALYGLIGRADKSAPIRY